MQLAKVIGSMVSTRKCDRLEGLKLMVVQEDETVSGGKRNTYVAADVVGAGIGERVLVVSGSTARKVFNSDAVPADMAIVGIIDSLEIDRAAK